MKAVTLYPNGNQINSKVLLLPDDVSMEELLQFAAVKFKLPNPQNPNIYLVYPDTGRAISDTAEIKNDDVLVVVTKGTSYNGGGSSNGSSGEGTTAVASPTTVRLSTSSYHLSSYVSHLASQSVYSSTNKQNTCYNQTIHQKQPPPSIASVAAKKPGLNGSQGKLPVNVVSSQPTTTSTPVASYSPTVERPVAPMRNSPSRGKSLFFGPIRSPFESD